MSHRPISIGPHMGKVIVPMMMAAAAILIYLSGQGLSGMMLMHAGAMIIAWGLFIPIGVMIARYFKITAQQDFPRQLDNHFWWNWHRGLQYAGVALSTAGFVAMANLVDFNLDNPHSIIGLTVVVIGWVQVFSGLLRGSKGGPTEPELRGDHYDMTTRRHIFEMIHKGLGWVVLPLSCAAIMSGMALVGLPNAALIGVLLFFACLVAFACVLEARKQRVSSYRAIWGVDGPALLQKSQSELSGPQSVAVTPPST